MNDNEITIKGKLLFDPRDVSKKHERQSVWKKTAIISFNDDLCEYYAWFVKKRYGITLNTPLRRSHLTIINDRIATNDNDYTKGKNKYNRREIEATFNTDIRTNGIHWWLKVTSKQAMEIRKFCGLDPNPYFNFHITIGHANERNLDQSKYIHKLLTKYDNEYN